MAISSPEMMLVPGDTELMTDQTNVSRATPRQTQVDITERAAANLAANAVLVTDAKVLGHNVSVSTRMSPVGKHEQRSHPRQDIPWSSWWLSVGEQGFCG